MNAQRLLSWLSVLALVAAPRAALAQSDELGVDLGGSLEGEASTEEGAAVEADVEGEAPENEEPSEEPAAAESDAVDEPAGEAPQAEDEQPPPAESEAPASVRAVSLYMAVGLGVGSLSFTRPTAVGVQHLTESTFAATELVLRIHAWPGRTFSIETQLAYQTSLGFALELRPLFALPEQVDVRVQRAELSIAPRIAFSSSKNALAVSVPVGFVYRSFFPEVHQYSVENHNLGSAFIRPELNVPLGELITLRAGPELHWLMLIEPSLEREGACCSGYALGLQGSVQAAVGSTFSVAIAYRQLHSVIPSAARFEDTERFLTARFGGAL